MKYNLFKHKSENYWQIATREALDSRILKYSIDFWESISGNDCLNKLLYGFNKQIKLLHWEEFRNQRASADIILFDDFGNIKAASSYV